MNTNINLLQSGIFVGGRDEETKYHIENKTDEIIDNKTENVLPF